jgi:hypothetical protein
MIRMPSIALIVLCSCSMSAFAAAPVYEVRDGVAVMEIESAPANGDCQPERDMEGYTGKGYYTWRGQDHYKNPGEGVFGFIIEIDEPGEYELYIRNRHDFEDSTLQNDCWTRMDDGEWVKTFSPKRGQWTWATRHEWSHKKKIQAAYKLDAGRHVLTLSGRSAGFSLDRIHLVRKGAKGALDAELPETRKGGEAEEVEGDEGA